ncbi:MAG: hypothetical protein V7727_18325, partial [Sneathiella sp.]
MSLIQNTSRWSRLLDHDITYSFLKSPVIVGAAVLTTIIFLLAFGAPLLTQYTPFNPSSLELMDGFMPPAWIEEGSAAHLLGTDGQGRDILAAIMYGTRVSLMVGILSVLLSVGIGIPLGIIAGYCGGWIDMIIMRIADIQLTIPPILIALMIDGLTRTV